MVPRHTSRAIDVARGLAALGVIWGHAIYNLGIPLELNGAFWVWVFLPISGYLVGRSFTDGGYRLDLAGFGRFLRNRSLRIVPLATLALVIGLTIHLAAGVAVPDGAWRQFLFVPAGNDMSLVGPLWTVAAEIQFYVLAVVLVPLMAGAWRLAGGVGGLTLWILIVAAWVASVADAGGQPRTLIGNLAFFVFGLLLASARPLRMRYVRTMQVVLVAAAAGLAWWLQNYKAEYFWRWGPHTGWPLGGGAACAIFITAAVVLLGVLNEEPSESWRRPPHGLILRALAWCGFYTYGIYVWHSILAVFNYQVVHIPPGPVRLALLLIAVPLAPLSYRWLEQPFLRLKSSRSRDAATDNKLMPSPGAAHVV